MSTKLPSDIKNLLTLLHKQYILLYFLRDLGIKSAHASGNECWERYVVLLSKISDGEHDFSI